MSCVIFKGCAVNRHLISVINRAAVGGSLVAAEYGIGNIEDRALDVGNCAAVAAPNFIVLKVGIFKGYFSRLSLVIGVNRRTVCDFVGILTQGVFYADVANREVRLIDNLKHGAARTLARIIPHGADGKDYIVFARFGGRLGNSYFILVDA